MFTFYAIRNKVTGRWWDFEYKEWIDTLYGDLLVRLRPTRLPPSGEPEIVEFDLIEKTK